MNIIYIILSDPNTDKGEGVKKSENFVDIIPGGSLTIPESLAQRLRCPICLSLHPPLGFFSIFSESLFPHFVHFGLSLRNEGRREEQKKQKRKLLAGKIAITVPEAVAVKKCSTPCPRTC